MKSTNFYQFFAPLMPTIDRLINGCQIISGLTASVGIWYVLNPYLSDVHWIGQVVIAGLLILLSIAIIEGGLRKIAPYAIRQTVWNNFSNRWWIAMYVPIVVVTMLLATSTTTLSWFASPEIVNSVKPDADTISLTGLATQYDSRRSDISGSFQSQKEQLISTYQNQADQIKAKHDSKRSSYKRRSKKADNDKDKNYLMYLADREKTRKKTALEGLAELQRTELGQITAKQNDALALIDSERSAIVGTAIQSNQSAVSRLESSVSIWSRFLAFISAGSTFILMFLFGMREVFKRGSADTPPNHIPSNAVVVPVSNQSNYAEKRLKETIETVVETKETQQTKQDVKDKAHHAKYLRVYWKRYIKQPDTETGRNNKNKAMSHVDALESLGYGVTYAGASVFIKPKS